jgi:predicted deacylase
LRAPFTLSETGVKPGTSKRVDIPVARVPSGMWLSLPVVVVHGERPGPALWLSAAVHGDELNGIAIIREVVERIDPRTLAGTVLAVPVVNVFGIIMESRYLPDRRDLNRSFPGSPRGSLAAQLANLFMTHVVERCEYGLDFHTGSDGRTNLPQTRCDLDLPEVRSLALAFGAPVALHAPVRKGSLRSAATARGCRVILYEAGEARRFHRRAIQVGVDGTLRVLRHLGMIDEDVAEPAATPKVAHRSFWVRARRSGLCQMRASLGDTVEAGQRIAMIIDTVGSRESQVRSRAPGLLIGHLNHAIVNRGDAVAHIAEFEGGTDP